MPTHDIIDNRREKLVDHINRILGSTEAARFAVGYFFLSGLTPIAERLAGVRELRLLVGNTTNRQTLEQIAEGYRRLELVAEEVEAAGAGFYESPWGTRHPRLQILTMADLLDVAIFSGKGIDMPSSRDLRTFKKAPKARVKGTTIMTRPGLLEKPPETETE